MRILIIHNEYRIRGGEYVAVKAQAALLHEMGHEVRLFKRSNCELDQASWLARLKACFAVIYSFRISRELRCMIRSWKPDVAHVHNVFPLLSPSVYRTLSKESVPMVQTVHNYRFMCANGLFLRNGTPCQICASGRFWPAVRYRCYRRNAILSFFYSFSIWLHRRCGTFRCIDRFVALSAFAREQIIQYHIADASKVIIIPNFTQIPKSVTTWPSGDRRILSFGRLAEEKDLGLVLDVAKRLSDIKFEIAGEGPMGAILREMARNEQLNNVTFRGQVSKDRIGDLLQQTHLVLITSKCFENLPFSLVEAMAHGRAVVAPNQGVFPGIIDDHKEGLLYPPGDVSALALLLRELLDEEESVKEYGEMAYQKAARLFSRESHVECLQKLYKELNLG